MTTYRDPFTLEEAMREIRANRKRVESQAAEIERLRCALENISAWSMDGTEAKKIARAALGEGK